MSISTQMNTVALAIILSASFTLAQQPVRRTVAKTAARPQTTAHKATTSQAKKPALSTSSAPKAQAVTHTPVANTAPAVARQTHAQPVTQAA